MYRVWASRANHQAPCSGVRDLSGQSRPPRGQRTLLGRDCRSSPAPRRPQLETPLGANFGVASRLLLPAAVALLSGLASAPMAAQDPPVFEVESALMEIEVRVTDRQGRAVPDLPKDSFELFENGEPQQIATFEFVSGTVPSANPEADSPVNSTQSETAVARSELRGSTFVYIATRGRRENRPRMVQAIRRFIDEQLAPGVFVSLEGSPFTSRRSKLQDELLAMARKGSRRPSGGSLIDTLAVDLARDIEYDQSIESLLEDTNNEFENQVQEIADRAALYRRLRMYEYIDLIRALGIYPGRKIVVLFSTGLPVDEDNIDIMKVLESEATRARVRFFVAGVSGLAASPPGGDAETRRGGDSLFGDVLRNGFDTQAQARQDREDGLFEVARRTGGRAVLNSNDFGEVFNVMARETSDYYLVGYYPQDTEQRGRLRRLRVRVEGKGLRVSHQRGYYEERPFHMTSRSERNLRLHHALTFDTPYTDLPLAVDHEFFRNTQGVATLVYSVGLHMGDIPTDSSKRGDKLILTVVAKATARDSGTEPAPPPVLDDRRFELVVPASSQKRYSNDSNSWLHYGSQMPLAPGSYDWKVVVRDDVSGLMGSFHRQLQIPEPGDSLGASSLLLTSRIDNLGNAQAKEVPAGRAEDVLKVEGSRFFASAVKKFRRGDPVYALYDVYNPDPVTLARPPGPMLALYRGIDLVETLPVTGHQTVPEAVAGRVRYLAALSTSDLQAGSYTLAAALPVAGGKGPVIMRQFEIEPEKSE